MTYAVDFDGVVHRYGCGWADGTIYDDPMPGAIEGLHRLLQQDAVFILTTREPEQVMPWLEQRGFDVTIDDRCGTCFGEGGGQELDADDRPAGPPWSCEDCKGSGVLLFWNLRGQLLVTNRKLPAFAYLDDRAVRFHNWESALTALGVNRRLLACGLCYEEWGEEVHPHPECPVGAGRPPADLEPNSVRTAEDTYPDTPLRSGGHVQTPSETGEAEGALTCPDTPRTCPDIDVSGQSDDPDTRRAEVRAAIDAAFGDGRCSCGALGELLAIARDGMHAHAAPDDDRLQQAEERARRAEAAYEALRTDVLTASRYVQVQTRSSLGRHNRRRILAVLWSCLRDPGPLPTKESK